MAGKEWTTSLGTAAAVAAGAGAAQLGLGYGLGVVRWPDILGADDSVWLGSLSWATWTAASATVFGAVVAGRLRGTRTRRPGTAWRFAVAMAAAIGALLTVALIALPARGAAIRSEAASPQALAAGYALLGIVLGTVVAYWAVVSRPVTANLMATAVWLWLLAAAAIVVELVANRPSATYLNSWQFAELDGNLRYGTIYWPSALVTLLVALVLGALAAWPSARRGELGLGTAMSGAVGPLLVSAAFFALAPQLTRSMGQLESAYLIAPYGVLAGLAGSGLAVAVGRSAERRRAARARGKSRPEADLEVEQEEDAEVGRTRTRAAADAGSDITGAPDAGRGTAGAAAGGLGSADPAAGGLGSGGATGARSEVAQPLSTPGEAAQARPRSAGATAARPDQPRASAAQPDPSRPAARRSDGSATGAARPGVTPAGPAFTAPETDKSGMARSDAPRAAAAQPEGPGATAGERAKPPRTPRARRTPAAAKPADEAPRRSTVSAPPASPPVARINPPRTDEPAPPAPRKRTASSDPDAG